MIEVIKRGLILKLMDGMQLLHTIATGRVTQPGEDFTSILFIWMLMV